MRTIIEEKCNVCGENTEFIIDDSATLLREATCKNCGASIRTSDIVGIIEENIKGQNKEKIRILNCSSKGKIHELYHDWIGYSCGEYFDGVASGEYKNDVMCIDLQNIPFEDNTFDIIISEDVLEHVYDINKSLKEINRVLKIGGKHIFTVPVHENIVTMSRKDNPIEVLHGDPLRPDGIKVITDFGRDIASFVDKFDMETSMKRCHVFHKSEEISFIDDEVKSYQENKKNMLSVFRYNSIVITSKKVKSICENANSMKTRMESKYNLAFTGERFVPGMQEKNMLAEHYQRYSAVLDLVKGKKVLDAACGAGYGSALMASKASEVTGIDLSCEAIEYAKENYGQTKELNYVQASIDNLPFPDDYFDVIVSFETIEHVDSKIQKKFIKEIKRCLKDDGILVMSSPDRRTYSDLRNFNNEYHVKEFYLNEFDEFLKREFIYVNHYLQGEQLISMEVIHSLTRCDNVIKILNDVEYDENKDLYIISVCSNRKIDDNKENLASLYSFKYLPSIYCKVNGEYNSDTLITPLVYDKKGTYRVRFNIANKKIDGAIRFDPLEKKCCEVELISIKTDARNYRVLPINSVAHEGSRFLFVNLDPMLEVIGDFSEATYIDFEYKLRVLGGEEVSILLNKNNNEDDAYTVEKMNNKWKEKEMEMKNERDCLIKELKQCSEELEMIKSSVVYQIYKFFRR